MVLKKKKKEKKDQYGKHHGFNKIKINVVKTLNLIHMLCKRLD